MENALGVLKTGHTRATALLSALIMLLMCFAPVGALADTTSTSVTVYGADGNIICSDTGAAPGNADTGENVTVRCTVGFTDIAGQDHTVRLYLGSMEHSVLTYFNGGGKNVGETYEKDGIIYKVCKETGDEHNGEYYLEITGFTVSSGSTLTFDTQAYFDKTTPNGAEWEITLNVDGEDRGTVTLKAHSDVEMQNTKTAANSNIILNNVTGADVIDEDIKYYIQAYTGTSAETTQTELGSGIAAVESYTLIDTITLPDGLYFNVSGENDEAVKSALAGMISADFGTLSVESFGKDGESRVNSVTFTYTKTNNNTDMQIADTAGSVTVKANSINAAEDAQSGTITNTLKTSYNIVRSSKAKETNEVSANVNVQRPTAGAISDMSKEIEDVSDPAGQFNPYWQNNSYLLEGDYVLYKISFKNSGNTELNDVTVIDTLPTELNLVDVTELNNNNHFEKHPYNSTQWTSNCWGNTDGSTTGSSDIETDVSDKTITFSNITLEGGQTFYGYVLAKVTAMPDGTQERTISNKAEINGVTVTADKPQRAAEPKLNITKTAVKVNNGSEQNVSVYNAGDTIKYYVTVSNSGTGAAENVTIKDFFPSDQITLSEKGITTPDGTNMTESTTEIGTVYSLSDIDIPVGESVTITMTGTVNNEVTGQIINTANAECGAETVKALNTLLPITEATDPSAKVGLTKTLTSADRYVSDGDIVTYRIAFTTESEFSADAPLIITDQLPNWLEYESFTGSKGVTAEKTDTGIKISYVGGAGEHHIDITLQAVNTAGFVGTTFANTARVDGGASASADPITVGTPPQEAVSSDGLKVEKTAYVMRDDEKVSLDGEDNIIEAGETVNFEIKITNTGNERVNSFTLYDDLDGSYKDVHSGLTLNVAKENNANADISFWLPMGFTGSYNSNTSEYELYPTGIGTAEFSPPEYAPYSLYIEPNGYIVLAYSLTTAKSFSSGGNAARVNDSGYSAVSYRSLSKLSIDKQADDGSEIICDSENTIDNKEIGYTVTVKNESFTPYTSSDVYFVDELPEGVKLAGAGNVMIGDTAQQAEFYIGSGYDPSDWTSVTESGGTDGRIVGVSLGSALTIPAGGELKIKYKVKLTGEKLEELKEEIVSNGSYDFTPQDLENNVYFHGGESFLFDRADGTTVTANTITASNTVTLRTKTSKPLLEKEAYAYMAPSSSGIVESESNADVGAYLIWKIKLTNLNEGSSDTMSDYVITDTLPDGYSYIDKYENSQHVKYPENLSDTTFKQGKIKKTTINQWGGSYTSDLEGVEPTIDGKTLTWNFTDDKYALAPGDSIEFTFITKPDEGTTSSGIYTNRAQVEVNDVIYEAFDAINTSASGSFALNSVKTTSKKTAETVGDKVTYTLTVRNDSAANTIENLTIIDRLPYPGDTGVLTSDARGSECDVTYNGDITVKLDDEELSGDDYKLSYSGDRNVVFDEHDKDWYGENGRVSWSDNYTDSTRLVRIELNKEVMNGQTVTVTFSGTIEADDRTKTNTVYNTFGYCYDSGMTQDMAAEAVKVGASLEASAAADASVTVTKNYINSSAGSDTFWFTVYDGEYGNGGQKIGDTKSLTLSGAADGTAVTANTTFDGLSYPTGVGLTKTYYIYETDAEGKPITQGSRNYIMSVGEEKAQSGEYCFAVINVTMSDRTHAVSFTNEVPQPKVTVTGPYVADVPVDHESAKAQGDNLKSGLAVDGTISDPVDDNNAETRNMKDIWDNGTMTEHSDGWGGDQGHTIATGFRAEITGAGTTVNSAIWILTSKPGNGNDVYVKLPEAGERETVGGNNIEKIFGDDSDIYKIKGNDPITMVLRLTLPTITLEDGSTAYVGIIIDGIYDKQAEAEMELNGEITAEQKQEMDAALEAADNATGTLVNSPDNENGFKNNAQ